MSLLLLLLLVLPTFDFVNASLIPVKVFFNDTNVAVQCNIVRAEGNSIKLHLYKNDNLIVLGETKEKCKFYAGQKASLVNCGPQTDGIFTFAGRMWKLSSLVNGQHFLQKLFPANFTSTKEEGLVRVRRQAEDEEEMDYYEDFLDEDDNWDWPEGDDWLDWDGYVVGQDEEDGDDDDEVDGVFKRRGEFVCNGPYCQYYKVKRDPQKWLEIAVAVDPSVVRFHGESRVTRYVLTLLNIVSSIYGDPTLGSNLQFVVSRILILKDLEKHPLGDPIVEGNSKQSLANVNRFLL